MNSSDIQEANQELHEDATAGAAMSYQHVPTGEAEAIKNETEVDLPIEDEQPEQQQPQAVEEEKKSGRRTQTGALHQRLQQARRDAANGGSQLRNQRNVSRQDTSQANLDANDSENYQKMVEVGIPLDMTRNDDDGGFSIKNGVVTGKLWEADQSGKFQDRHIQRGKYCCDTVKKEFGQFTSKGVLDTAMLQPMFQVDGKLVNPAKRFEFVIMRSQVPLSKYYQCPFAILSSGQVRVFWARNENQKDLWIKAIRSLAGPEAGGIVGEITEKNQIVMNDDNFYATQVYMFLKREHSLVNAMPANQVAGVKSSDGDGEGGGGEPAEEAQDVKQFSLKTVTNDTKQIKGFLYKTAQSIGFMQKDYFIRRYYVLNKETKVMTIHERPDGKAQHTLKLADSLMKVHTGLNTFLKPDYMKNFRDDVKNLELPKDNPLPFAIFVKNQVAILWAATDLDYDLWTEALQAIQSMPTESTEIPVVELCRKNRFVTSLLAALSNEQNTQLKQRPRVHSVDIRRMPTKPAQKVVSYQSKTLIVMSNKIEGQIMKTAQKLSTAVFKGKQKDHFYLRHYCLDLTSKTLYIFRVGKSEPDLTVNFFQEGSQVIDVDTNLTHHKVVNYLSFFKTQSATKIHTGGEFHFPLAVRLQKNKLMLLWCAAEGERSIWAQAFKDLMPPVAKGQEKPAAPKQKVTTENEFVATLYKCLVPAFGPDGKPLPVGTDFRIRIEQQTLLMKTSQRWGAFMGSKKYYHLRFYQLNIATGMLKAFVIDGDKRQEKGALDLRNKVVHVKRLGCTFKQDYVAIMNKHNQHKINELTTPYDYKFPFLVYYLGRNDTLQIMVLWANSERNRNDWVDAFDYILTEFEVTPGKTIDDMMEADLNNSFSVALSKSLEPHSAAGGDAPSSPSKKPSTTNAIENQTTQRSGASATAAAAPQEELKQPAAESTQSNQKRKSDSEVVEEYWDAFKTETPVENLISGQGTFQIQPKCSMGLIRARKELFDNNYDPDTIVSCFLVIDFDTSLIGIRSVDKSFSAMVRLRTNDLVRIQDNDFDIHDQVSEDSECLSNTIELILARKSMQIAPNHPSEKSLIVNELNRAKLIQEMGSTKAGADQFQTNSSAASNQQMHAAQDDGVQAASESGGVKNAESSEVTEPKRFRRTTQSLSKKLTKLTTSQQDMASAAEDEEVKEEVAHIGGLQAYGGPVEGDEEEYEDDEGVPQSHVIMNGGKEPAEAASPMFTQAGKRQWSSVRGHQPPSMNQGTGQRFGRFDREVVVLGGGHQPIIKADRKRKMRDQYTEDDSSRQQLQQEEPRGNQQANNQQDLTDDSQAEAGRPQVIPLNRIKFTAPGLAADSKDMDMNYRSAAGHQIRKNSFFTEEGDSSAAEGKPQINIQNMRASNNEQKDDAGFFQTQSQSSRNKMFNQQNNNQQQPIVLKMRKKKTENSQVRSSLQQSLQLNQTVSGSKIDFHATTSFRDAFPQQAGLGTMRPMRPGDIAKILNQTNQQPIDYEQKIQDCRDDDFIEKLVARDQFGSSQVGNRFMSPAVRLSTADRRVAKANTEVMNSTGPIKVSGQQMAMARQDHNQAGDDNENYDATTGEEQNHQPSAAIKNGAVPISNRQARQAMLQSHQRQTASAYESTNRAKEASKPKKDDGELSDWDSDSDEGGANKKAKLQLTMNAQIPVRNVRDRRSSNVYHGELISPTSKPKVNQSATMRASSLKNQDIEVEDWD